MRNPYAAYANNSINTAPKEELTLMLYEGAIKFMNKCIIATEKKDYVGANEANKRVQDIIREFQCTLNYDYPISKDFNALYDYIYRRLIEGNIKKDIEILNEVLDLLREFRDMWKEAMYLAKTQKK